MASYLVLVVVEDFMSSAIVAGYFYTSDEWVLHENTFLYFYQIRLAKALHFQPSKDTVINSLNLAYVNKNNYPP